MGLVGVIWAARPGLDRDGRTGRVNDEDSAFCGRGLEGGTSAGKDRSGGFRDSGFGP